VISERGMAKCLALGYPLRKQLDSALSELSQRIRIYGGVPQLVPNDESFGTTIQLPLQSLTKPPPQPKQAAKPPKAPRLNNQQVLFAPKVSRLPLHPSIPT
jgi:hypothetical protein